MKKMVESNASGQAYKNIALVDLAILLALIEVYYTAGLRGFFSGLFAIENQVTLDIIDSAIEVVLFGVVYTVIYSAISFFYRAVWISKNREFYVQGQWLHIHKKDTLRIGVVDITQDFYNINASAENVTPNIPGHYVHNKRTQWSYIIGEVDSDHSSWEYVACYEAKKTDVGDNNSGLHMLKIRRGTDGYPVGMDGRFSDIFKASDTLGSEINSHQRQGELHLYRMSKEVKKHLYENGHLDYDRLEDLCNNERFQDELFVRDLKKFAAGMGKDNKVPENSGDPLYV